MNTVHDIRKNTLALEHAVLPFFGSPHGDELPQVAGSGDIEIDLICEITGKPWEVIQGYKDIEH